jgi:hypothetical protein
MAAFSNAAEGAHVAIEVDALDRPLVKLVQVQETVAIHHDARVAA